MNLMVTANQKPIMDACNSKDLQTYITIKKNYQIARKESKEEESNIKEIQNSQNTVAKCNKDQPLNNYLKCKWTQCSNVEKIQNSLVKKTNKATTKRKQPRPICTLPTETQIRSKDTD